MINLRPLRIVLCVLFFTACQTGRIPCPKPDARKSVKAPKRYKYVREVSQIRSDETPDEQPMANKSRGSKFVGNVSIEEWDCPEPGKKKYLPKKIRNNIQRNYYRVLAGYNDNPRDSVSN